jgi:hypothetical protein
LGVQIAQPRSTAVQYSNAIDFGRASLPSNAQIHAQACLDDRHAPSSQRGGQGFESPQLHRDNRIKGPLPIRDEGLCGVWGEVQKQSTAVIRWNLSEQGCSRLTRKLVVKEYLFLSNISWTLVW